MISIQVPKRAINDAYLPYLKAQERTQIYFGGSSSGKSVFLAQRDLLDLLEGGRNFLICRQVGKTLRGSVIQEIRKVITKWNLSNFFKVNKTDGTVTCINGYQMVFVGLDDVEKLKSVTPAKGVFTDIRIEEATEADEPTVKQLLKRQRGGDETTAKRLVLSFNPILQQHWIYKTYFENIGWADGQTEYRSDDLLILKTTYKDNRFLTKADIHDLESETDPYFYNVYTLGNWGVLGDVIFTNWKVTPFDDELKAQFTNRMHGLDFGFASDPAAAAFTHYDRMRKIIYIYGEIYERDLTNDVLAERLKPWTIHTVKVEDKTIIVKDEICCDSAEPKSIAELRKLGLSSYGAKKGKDSVTFGIDWLKQQTILIDVSCINSKNEIQSYQWKKDAGGNSIKVPVDRNNHLMDALRYAYEREALEIEFSLVENGF